MDHNSHGKRGSTQAITIIAMPAIGADGERLAGQFDAYLGTRLLVVRTRQPFVDGARALLALGFDPATTVILKHLGSEIECLRGRLGVAARLTVKERDRGRVIFERWEDVCASSLVALPSSQTAPAGTEGHPERDERASAGVVS
jgi:hypothetical protein